jgi:hypothetical protein
MTEAKRTAPEASFQVNLAGTLIDRRSVDRWLVLASLGSATALLPGFAETARHFTLNAPPNPSSAPNLCSPSDPRATYDFTGNRTYLKDFVDVPKTPTSG